MGRSKATGTGERIGKAAEAGRDIAEAKAAVLAARLRDADALHRASARSAELAATAKSKVRAAQLDERAAELAAAARERLAQSGIDERAAELAAAARLRLAEAHLDERAAELAARVRESEPAERAAELAARVRESETAERARKAADASLEKLGAWVATTPAGEKLGFHPPTPRRGRAVLLVLLGAALGFAAAWFGRSSSGGSVRDDLAESAQRLAEKAASVTGRGEEEPAALVDRVRSALEQDPATASLPRLNINVADGTVFIRGAVPSGVDEDTIRGVVARVEGVRDVDVQVSALSP